MLFQIQKELVQKRTNLLDLINSDRSKYEKLKKEYKKLSASAKQNLTDKMKVYLLFVAIRADDVAFIKLLVDTHQYEKIELNEAKIAVGLVYSNIKQHKKVVQFLLPFYEKLSSSDLTRLTESLFEIGQHKDCEKVLTFAQNRFSEMLGWKIELLHFQIKVLHSRPKDKQFIAENLKALYQQCKTPEQYSRIAICFFYAGYFKDMVNMFDVALQKIMPISPIAENHLFDSSGCRQSMDEIIDILESKNIKPFPIAGSLLGLFRDGKFMNFDKDADIGIFVNSYDEIFNIVATLCKLSKFISPMMVNHSKESHVWNVAIQNTENSTSVDLFFFYKEPTKIVYGLYTPCATLKWAFKPFELTRQALAGREYWLPENIEQHLVEMYGENWREPIEAWDSLLNCPNLTADSQPVAIYYGLMRLWEALQKNKTKKALNYYQTLTTRWGMRFSPEAEANVRKLLGLE